MSDFASTRVDLTGVGSVPGTATSTKSSGVASFNILGYVVSAQVPRDLTVAVGDVCLLVKYGAQWFATQRYYTAAPADPGNDALPNPQPSTYSGTTILPALETRSYKDGDIRLVDDDLYQGNSGTGLWVGAAYYSESAYALNGATIASATLRMARDTGGGNPAAQSLTLVRISEDDSGSGAAPTLGTTTAGPSLAWGDVTDFSIPTSWVTDLSTGTIGGIGIYVSGGTPFVRLLGRGRYPNSFSITVNWSR